MLGLDSAKGDRVFLGEEVKELPSLSERLIGKYGYGMKGNTLVITADALGNERSGIKAIQNVLTALMQLKIPIYGQLVGLAGNIGSYEKGLLGELEDSFSIENDPSSQDEYLGYNKAKEFVELIEEFENISSTNIFHLDIKTSPNPQYPYLCHSRNLNCRKFASHFPFHKVTGLTDYLTDHLGFYLNAKNYTCSTLKVGTGGPYSAEQIHESAIWWALIHSGCLQESDIPDLLQHREILNQGLAIEEAGSFEVIFKYKIKEDEFFRMIPGYVNFQKIKAGEILATSDGAPVVSQWEGRIFMPLYHTRYNDGFFILRELT